MSLENFVNTRKSNVLAIMIALFMATDIYFLPVSSFALSVGEVSLIIVLVWITVSYDRVRVYQNPFLWLFAAYSVLSSLIVSALYEVNLSSVLSRIIRDSFYWILIYMYGYSFVDLDDLKKWVRKICIALSIFILIQEIVFFTTGYLVPGFLLNARVTPSETGITIYQHLYILAQRNGYLKAPGFLSESAHCAQMLMIGAIALFDFEEGLSRKKLLTIALFSLASIMSFSASSVIYIVFVWGIIIFFLIKAGKTKYAATALSVLLMGAFVFVLFILQTGSDLNSVLGRLTSASSVDSADRSSYLRLYKGFEYYANLPFNLQIFGIGFGNYSQMKGLYQGVMSEYMEGEYMNTISYILVSSGIIGFTLFASFIWQMFVSTSRKGKLMIGMLLLMIISASPYSSPNWVWMILFIILESSNGAQKKYGLIQNCANSRCRGLVG